MDALFAHCVPQNIYAVLVQVYALLHRQEVFAPFRSQPRFADLMENIFLVLDHFNAKVRCWPQELYSNVPLVDVECYVLCWRSQCLIIVPAAIQAPNPRGCDESA